MTSQQYHKNQQTMANSDDSSSDLPFSDDDYVDLQMSDGSSDFGVGSDDSLDFCDSTRPYMFEPETDSSCDEGNTEAIPEVQTLRLESNEWCECGHCHSMPTETECICCQEIKEAKDLMSRLPNSPNCITKHPGFEAVCLNVYVLETAYLTFRQDHGHLPDDQNKRNRYIAYRQLVRWCWGWLGRHVRVTLPACAVSAIRDTFPSPDGQYNGFNFD